MLAMMAGPGSRYYAPADPPPEGDEPTLWVNSSTGDDSRSKATVAGSAGSLPWETLTRAMWGSTDWASPNASEAAAAGDVVSVVGNQSEAGHTGASNATWYPVNSGSSGNPIIFQAAGYLTGTRVTLSLTSAGTYLGNRDSDYITFYGFRCDDLVDDAFNSGGINYMINGNNIEVGYCNFQGQSTGVAEGNNYSGIFTSGVNNYHFHNCTFDDFGRNEWGADENHCGIDTYNDAHHGLIEHCEFRDCGSGFYHKAAADFTGDPVMAPVNGPVTVRYCLFTECTQGIRFHRSAGSNGNEFLVHNILFIDCAEGAINTVGFTDDGSDPAYGHFANLTAINCPSERTDGGAFALFGPHANANMLLQNCIVSGGIVGLLWFPSEPAASDIATYVRNQVNGQSTNACSYNGSDMSLAAWAGTSGISDTASISTAPTFVDAGAGNYRLASNGQAALTLGRVVHSIGGTNGDTIPAGCYITGTEEIGLEA